MKNKIMDEILLVKGSKRASELTKLAKKYEKQLPDSDIDLINYCEEFIAANNSSLFSVATLWLKSRKSIIDLNFFPIFERWLLDYVLDWWQCDQYCYRVLNPFIMKYPQLFENVRKWMKSDKTYVKRAAPVSLIISSQSMRVEYDFDKIIEIVDYLKTDNHIHIQKGIGWLLKYAYLQYPEKIKGYLVENVKSLSRTTFRYALEKAPRDVKTELMKK